MQQSDVCYQHCLNMFRALLCRSSGEQRPCVTACGVLRWFCWMWLVAVVGRSLSVTFTVLAPYNAAPHNRYQPHPAEPAQHTTCSNTRLVLLKMGIIMPETCWDSVDNKHLIVASCWFSLFLHNLLTMHGHRNLNLKIHVPRTGTGNLVRHKEWIKGRRFGTWHVRNLHRAGSLTLAAAARELARYKSN